ncbi:MAG: PQQ-dependent sugar dehydrogenase, partial [Alkalimonas sp.]|nr:PQQ-dependent sugar dehydrogenase [Alkalimonas sp.]
LVTERTGTMRYVTADGENSAPIEGLPDILVNGQGGLLDVVLAPDFADSQQVYFSYNEPADSGSSTAVARAVLNGQQLEQLEVIFSAQPKINSRAHFGSRLVFTDDGYLFITLGDRGSRRDDAQTLDTHHGKVVRLYPDGRVPASNPYVNKEGALDEIWSYGHRNIQGAALHPETRQLWTHEHGPQGGDEVNITEAGKNYGWPVITYGEEYGGGVIGKTHKEGMEQPLYDWTPSIAPSGMAFYTGDLFTGWQGDLLVGALRHQLVARLVLDGDSVAHEERIDIGMRVRDVRQGPDGAVYLLTDERNGKVLKLTPAAD